MALAPNERLNSDDPYGCPNKHKSREMIWRALGRLRHPPLSNALMMPGSERFELDVALSVGFRAEQTFLVEKSPAVLANFTRRHSPQKQHAGKPLPPRSHIMRMYLSQAAKTLLERGVRIDSCHLDFCSNCEAAEMTAEIHQFIQSGVLKDESFVAITFLAGREKHIDSYRGAGSGFEVTNYDDRGRQMRVLQGFSDADKGRIRHVWETVGFDVTVRQVGKYQNTHTNNPMCWLVFHCRRREIIGGKSGE